MTDQKDERRRDLRVTFRTSVKLCFSEGRTFNDCETIDISVSGVFVKGITGVDFDEKCSVVVNLSGRTSNLVLEMSGEVVRAQNDGVAIQFFDVDEDSFYHLQNIVYFSYKLSGGGGDVLAEIDDVDDESLYRNLDSNPKTTPLPDNYLDDLNSNDEEEIDDDSVSKIAEEIIKQADDDSNY